MRKPLGGTAEHLAEPADSFLVGHFQEFLAVKDVGQRVWAGVTLLARRLLRHPNVPPPSRKRQQTEGGEAGCNNDCDQASLSENRFVSMTYSAASGVGWAK